MCFCPTVLAVAAAVCFQAVCKIVPQSEAQLETQRKTSSRARETKKGEGRQGQPRVHGVTGYRQQERRQGKGVACADIVVAVW